MSGSGNGTATLGDVMVVGGGISGIQAALDLAQSGYKVFLVEQAPTIGGTQASGWHSVRSPRYSPSSALQISGPTSTHSVPRQHAPVTGGAQVSG